MEWIKKADLRSYERDGEIELSEVEEGKFYKFQMAHWKHWKTVRVDFKGARYIIHTDTSNENENCTAINYDDVSRRPIFVDKSS